MAKSFTNLTSVATGDVLTATNFNNLQTTVNSHTIPPMCKATKNATQSIPNTTATVITFATEDYDTDGMHDTSLNTSRITINTAGVYIVEGFILSAASSGSVYGYIYKNGAALPSNTGIKGLVRDSATAAIDQVTVPLSLAVGDYVELAFYHASGSAINVTADCWLAAHFVGRTS